MAGKHRKIRSNSLAIIITIIVVPLTIDFILWPTYIYYLIFTTTLKIGTVYCTHFKARKTEAQKCQAICPRLTN